MLGWFPVPALWPQAECALPMALSRALTSIGGDGDLWPCTGDAVGRFVAS